MSDIIASVSGIRGITGDSLTPHNITKFTSAFAEYCRRNSRGKLKIVIGRDGRIFGDIIEQMVMSNLALSGFEVINIGVAPTPTVQIATEDLKCAGGISITASHNPQIWNGLKFLNPDGTFLDEKQVEEFLKIADEGKFKFAGIENLIPAENDFTWLDRHVEKVLKLKILNLNKIRKAKFKVVVDAVNSSGSVIVPMLLERLGCKVIKLFCDGSGKFPHTPEPIPENLKLLSKAVKKNKADFGISVDPDADRLVLITEKGEPFSEENTITAVSNFVLKNTSSKNKNVTVNLSTTRSIDDIAKKNNGKVFRSPVGEINVVKEMQKNKSVIGGEGSGGVIYPELHYGRDSLAGIVLILNEFADSKKKISEYKSSLPRYFISKTKRENLKDPDKILKELEKKYRNDKNVIKIWNNDGLKIDFKNYWIHMRKSNTEPIIRIITEAGSMTEAEEIANDVLSHTKSDLK
ncbi:MAG: phosphoglucosamine mutase [Ignavibacteria bacterium]|nr:phosphoglucosamine mutase [Ignavibacteria bacterium]